ncbi:unnamed protein product [Calicophoron daubneyi]|uniref:Uncharacterized protein n=1 Tax=Calicophoron daubneyi TaxID=300641 RepID=A0AAV2TMA2_CALDB
MKSMLEYEHIVKAKGNPPKTGLAPLYLPQIQTKALNGRFISSKVRSPKSSQLYTSDQLSSGLTPASDSDDTKVMKIKDPMASREKDLENSTPCAIHVPQETKTDEFLYQSVGFKLHKFLPGRI